MTRRERLALLAGPLLAAGCAAARLPPVTDAGFSLERDEKLLWRDAEEFRRSAERSGALHADEALDRYLTGLARKLAPPAAVGRLRVSVRVLGDHRPGAFALPDGGIYLTTGMLARIEDEAQLATLIGHELIHAVDRHAVVEYRTFKNGAAVTAVLPGAQVLGLGALGTKAAVTGYSRELEREADAKGFALMVAAGYDARRAPGLFEHLAAWLEEEDVEEPYFFGTHPRVRERLESFRELARAAPAGRRAEVGQARYRAAVADLLLANARLTLSAGRPEAAARDARRHLQDRPRSAAAHALLGDAARRGAEGAGDPAEHYRRAIDLDPRCAEAHRGLGSVLAERGDRAGARAALAKYLALRPDAEDRAWVKTDLESLGRKP